jgi:tetratricopeptide (TPR) repeat protein
VQKTSCSNKRDRRHISVVYGLLLSFSIFAALQPALAEESGEAKPRPKTYDPEAVKHYNTGLELQNSGFLNKAVQEYRAAIKADDRLEQAFSNLGLIFLQQKNYSRAQEAFDRALAIKPNRPNSLNGLASVLYAQNKVDEAIEEWKKVIHFNPRFASAYFNMGIALEKQDRHGEALDAYVKAVTIQPDMADAYYHLGRLMEKQKHLAQALKLLEHSVELAPEAEFARDARKRITVIQEIFAKEPGDSTVEVPMIVHPAPSAKPEPAAKAPGIGGGDANKEVAAKSVLDGPGAAPLPDYNASTTDKGITDKASADTGSSDNGAPAKSGGGDMPVDAAASKSGSNSAGADTTGSTTTTASASGNEGGKQGKKKRKTSYKKLAKPANDEERQAQTSPPTEMKMYVKPSDQGSDLQTKQQ